ncbi:MAG: 4-hydroxy-3-methylbut-2-enyl diphosphate reductase 2, partial [Frankiales bacterium]|nr:4-hydroxy-3-methylbut-2-enyl diphosphate reductase 2 [Frankiales bacterium]
TTLAAEESDEVIDALRQRFPLLQSPPTEDICYATTNRQKAVQAVAQDAEVVLVVGSPNSANSNRLVDIARQSGAAAFLVEDAGDIDPAWFQNSRVIGLTAGASASEDRVTEVVDLLRSQRSVTLIEREVTKESIHFGLPAPVSTT